MVKVPRGEVTVSSAACAEKPKQTRQKAMAANERMAKSLRPQLSDRGVRRGTCIAGGKVAAEAGAVTRRRVRCGAWLGVSGCWRMAIKPACDDAQDEAE
jgi:hypothetical protein